MKLDIVVAKFFLKTVEKKMAYVCLNLIFALQNFAHGSKKINPQVLDLFFYLVSHYHYIIHRVSSIFLDCASGCLYILCSCYGYYVKTKVQCFPVFP